MKHKYQKLCSTTLKCSHSVSFLTCISLFHVGQGSHPVTAVSVIALLEGEDTTQEVSFRRRLCEPDVPRVLGKARAGGFQEKSRNHKVHS